MEATKNYRKEKVHKAKNPEEFRKIVKLIHDDSTDLGDVTKHITLESKVNSPFKVALEDWDDADGIEPEGHKSIRSIENKQRCVDNAASVKAAKNVINVVDLYLEDDVISFIKETHPEYRVAGDINAYLRIAAQALAGQRDLNSEEKKRLKEDHRRNVQKTECSFAKDIGKVCDAAKNAEQLILLLGLPYTVEEMLFDIMYGFKGDMTLVKCKIEEDTQTLKDVSDAIAPGTAGRPAAILALQTKSKIPTSIDKLSAYVRNFKFPALTNEISKYTTSLMTKLESVSSKVDGVISNLVDSTVLSTAAAEKIGFKNNKKRKNGRNKQSKDLSSVICNACDEPGHYSNYCPVFKEFIKQKKSKKN